MGCHSKASLCFPISFTLKQLLWQGYFSNASKIYLLLQEQFLFLLKSLCQNMAFIFSFFSESRFGPNCKPKAHFPLPCIFMQRLYFISYFMTFGAVRSLARIWVVKFYAMHIFCVTFLIISCISFAYYICVTRFASAWHVFLFAKKTLVYVYYLMRYTMAAVEQ